MNTTPALELVHVSRSFGPVEVLHDLNFKLIPGRVHALIGENGAGKSTAMKILCGYLEPSRGEVRIDGAQVQFRTAQEADHVHRDDHQIPLANNVRRREYGPGREKRKGSAC